MRFGFSLQPSNVRIFSEEMYKKIITTAASRYRHTLSALVKIRYGVTCRVVASLEQLSEVLRTKRRIRVANGCDTCELGESLLQTLESCMLRIFSVY